ncbi:YpoC family protein [Neobacillus sp. SCS-31]|uniref:YpoC family protein n=1 Tax=Neobacillus oceani TaxID=3115292 RepID=UPI00390623F9
MSGHIPSELDHPFFKGIITNPTAITADVTLFAHEISYFSGESGKWPWNVPDESVPKLFAAWECLREDISLAFKIREKASILSAMRKGVGLFLHVLFWSNGQPVSLASMPGPFSLSVKPANCRDRIQFLIDRPGLFHSFIQLCELMDEQYKHFQVKLAKVKKNR